MRREVFFESMVRDGVGSELVPARLNVTRPELPPRVLRRMNLAMSVASEDNTCSHSPPQELQDDGSVVTQGKILLPGRELYYNATGLDEEQAEQWLVDTHAECKRNRCAS